jgi:hypothetical protein
MDKKQMTIIGVVAAAIVLYFILKSKTTTAKQASTARSNSLAAPLTSLIGSGVTLLSNFVKAGVDYFSGNKASQGSSGVPAIDVTAYQTTDIYSPFYSGGTVTTEIASDMSGYFDSQGIGLPM